jgi:hypothetical protein
MSQFRVVVEGRVLPGFDPRKVRAALAQLVRKDELFAARLLGGRSTCVKSVSDAAIGQRYLEALRAIGVSCHIESDGLEFDASIVPGDAHLDFDRDIVPGQVIQERLAPPSGQEAATPRNEQTERTTPRRLWSTRRVVALAVSVLAIAVVGTLSWTYSLSKQDTRVAHQAGAPIQLGTVNPAPSEPPMTPSVGNRTQQELPVPAASQANADRATRELAELVKRFMAPSGQSTPAIDAGAEPESPIAWQAPIGNTQRGIVVPTVGGRPVAAARADAAKWEVVKTSHAGRLSEVELSGLGIDLDVESALRARGLMIAPFKCQDVQQSASESTHVFQLSAAERSPAWLSWNHSCGTAGCSERMTLYYSADLAAKVDCGFVDPDQDFDGDAPRK